VATSRLLAAAGVVCAGALAAWPFRQPPARSAPPPLATAPLALPLRREEVVLLASPLSEVSPATNLEAIASALASQREPDKPAQPARRTFELTNLAPPPPLPFNFQPVAASEPSPATGWRPLHREPPALPRAAVSPARLPRTYRLRDGDTLENVAERFLGSAGRAAEIFEANRDALARPDLLPVGKTIVLPPKLAADELGPASR
jgi:nucleoid-associated protein YgaU